MSYAPGFFPRMFGSFSVTDVYSQSEFKPMSVEEFGKYFSNPELSEASPYDIIMKKSPENIRLFLSHKISWDNFVKPSESNRLWTQKNLEILSIKGDF